MSRFKMFIENFFVYGLGGIIGKIIPFLMLPIITRLMPDTFYFGLNDMSIVGVSFGSALAVMGMYDAMYRMFFEYDDEKYKKEICSTAFFFTLIMSSVVFIVMIIFRKWFSELLFNDDKYVNLLCLTAISILIGATNTIISAPTRMQNKKKLYLITNLLAPFISYSVSIPLLIKGHYIIALPIASVVSALSIEVIFGTFNYKWFSLKFFNYKHLKPLLCIALPLLPNLLMYWIFNSCDRLMIAKMLGAEANGIYAIGGKVGQISQLIYVAFSGGWQYFSFRTMKDKDQVIMNSKIFEYLAMVSFISFIVITSMCRVTFEILFVGEYESGYIVVPYLFLAPLLLMLFQVSLTQFLIIKKTWPCPVILLLGAITNVILNYYLIDVIGVEGAAISTLIGYIVSIVIENKVLTKMNLIKISRRFYVGASITVMYWLLWRFFWGDNLMLSMLFASGMVVLIVMLYKNELLSILKKGK